ncbi:MAG: oxidoreductase [Chryseobacterium sp.]|nr:MAG: oxidoreductase [Chryseobacterium sp.]
MITTGNTILITGGSSGIGFSLAKRFCELGNKVIITGRNKKKLLQIKDEYPKIDFFSGDLTLDSSLRELESFILLKYPDLNILINNAAVQYNYNFLDNLDFISVIDYEISANLSAPIKLTALLLPILTENYNTAIVNVSSGLFIAPKKTASVYCATKSAIHSFSRTLRYQLERTDTKVFEIIPSLIDTPMTSGRGRSKISTEQLTDEFLKNFETNKLESYIGKTKLLRFINRLSPTLSFKIMKDE